MKRDFFSLRRSAGFTLVEFMIAATIGLAVTLAVSVLFVSSKNNMSVNDDVSRLQESIRLGSEILNRTIRMTGYRTNSVVASSYTFPASSPALSGVDNTTATGMTSGTDTLTVRYQGTGTGTGSGADGGTADCMGNALDASNTYANSFAVRPNSSGGTSLFCSTDGGATWPSANEVMQNVQNMQILYGEDITADGSADRFVRIGDVQNIDNIVSVQLWILVRSPGMTSTTTDTSTYTLAGVNYGPFNDRYYRRILHLNVNLRNRTQ
jgi:type IV pilus assembly protein PilW